MSEKYPGDIHGQGGDFVTSYNTNINKYTDSIVRYIKLLEDRLIDCDRENQELKQELETIKHNQELTKKWARGEIEN